MSEFPNLFNGKLDSKKLFSKDVTTSDILAFLKGVRDNPGSYLPVGTVQQQLVDAALVAGAFITKKGNDIIGKIAESPLEEPKIFDVCAALGYLFDTQKPSTQAIEEGFRPILHVYGRLMDSCKSAMTAVVFDNTGRFHYGSTISIYQDGNKKEVQLHRYNQLKVALTSIQTTLPDIPPTLAYALSKALAGNLIFKTLLIPQVPKGENFIKLYTPWINTFVRLSSESGEFVLVFRDDGDTVETLNKLAADIAKKEQEQYKIGVVEALKVTKSLKKYLVGALLSTSSSRYGHCAETIPFINLINDGVVKRNCQGLAMNPELMATVQEEDFQKGPAVYNNKKDLFRKPCRNCEELLERIGMVPEVYNTYLTTEVAKFYAPR